MRLGPISQKKNSRLGAVLKKLKKLSVLHYSKSIISDDLKFLTSNALNHVLSAMLQQCPDLKPKVVAANLNTGMHRHFVKLYGYYKIPFTYLL